MFNFIAADLTDADGNIIEHGVFMSLQELHQYSNQARMDGLQWVPSDKWALALKRWRANLCPFCGVCVGSNHRDDCKPGDPG